MLVHLADLASVTTATLQALLNEIPSNPNHIIYSQWHKRDLEEKVKIKATVPAIFPKAAFDSLLALRGDKGAKKSNRRLERQRAGDWCQSPRICI